MPTVAKQTETPATATTVVPATVTSASGGGCAEELTKYDWPQDQAHAIMMIESVNDPSTINDSPRTGDYSVGCFQINLIGEMRNTRPAESWLLVAENNVSYAYQMYVSQGRTFCKTSGWHNSCIKAGIE